MPAAATPAMQADAFAELLDALGVERVDVVAYSAGSPSAIQLDSSFPVRDSAAGVLFDSLVSNPEVSTRITTERTTADPDRISSTDLAIPSNSHECQRTTMYEESRAEQWVVGDLDDQPRQHQVLFDLFVGEPWREPAPRRYEPGRDHRSGSISAFSRRFQRRSM